MYPHERIRCGACIFINIRWNYHIILMNGSSDYTVENVGSAILLASCLPKWVQYTLPPPAIRAKILQQQYIPYGGAGIGPASVVNNRQNRSIS